MDNLFDESLSKPKARGDRFVVPRASLPEICRKFTRNVSCQNYNGEIWSTKYLKQKKYIHMLDEAFNLAPLKKQQSKVVGEWSWPCLPRKKNYLSSADNILDLPAYRFSYFPRLLDWSSDDILVAALGTGYHMWSWRAQNTISRGNTISSVLCCKFDPTGKLLLLGTAVSVVEVHNNELGKRVFALHCVCPMRDCSITCIDWSPTGKSFVTGCSNGTVCSMDMLDHLNDTVMFRGSVHMVKISPNARFVAAVELGGDAVVLHEWPSLLEILYLPVDGSVTDMEWHPWRSSLLAVATLGAKHSRITVWEPSTTRHRAERVGKGNYSVDAMLFSHRTGELVLSLWDLGVHENMVNSSQLVVMSDFETVVDQWGEGRSGIDRVRTMVFSPDGTKLATATADEDLIIWNFLPNDYKQIKNCKRFSALPQYLDEASHGYSFRSLRHQLEDQCGSSQSSAHFNKFNGEIRTYLRILHKRHYRRDLMM